MRISHRSLLHAATMACLLTPAGATSLLTTLNLTTPVNNVAGANRIVYEWTTPLSSGAANSADVTNLTMRLYNGATLLYSDTVISGGVMQGFGGAARTAADFAWDFDLNTNTLNQMRNVFDTAAAASTGTQYIVEDNVSLPADAMVVMRRVQSGSVQGFAVDLLASQSTVATPEPATTALMGAALLALAWRRRR